MLSADGVAKAHSSKWDPENLCATSNLDLELDAVATESSDKGWLPSLQLEVVEFDTENIEWQAELHKRATDADSVSTFASKARVESVQNRGNNESNNENLDLDNTTPIKVSKKSTKSINHKKFSNVISPSQKDNINSHDDNTNASDNPSVASSKKSEDLKDRKPDDQDTMKTSRSAVNSLEGAL